MPRIPFWCTLDAQISILVLIVETASLTSIGIEHSGCSEPHCRVHGCISLVHAGVCLPFPYHFLTNSLQCGSCAELTARCEGSHVGFAGVCLTFPYHFLTKFLPSNSKESFLPGNSKESFLPAPPVGGPVAGTKKYNSCKDF